MIKFFRSIRQQLLSENKFSKYLVYAIGEIILVVIGILIALQVNTWNQTRKDNNFETTMLHEIKSSLESDLEYLEICTTRIKLKQKGIQELLRMAASNQIYADTSLLKAYNLMNTALTFNYNKGGYEAIKSVGMDRISNDSLRKMLIETYEVRLPQSEKLIGYLLGDGLTSKDYKLQLHNKLWKRIQIQLPNKEFKIVSKPIDGEMFLNQSELIDRIKIEQDVVSALNLWFNVFQRTVQNCLRAVNQELIEV